MLRSESPELVLQEIWGHLCCHYAIRTMMWEPADHAHVDPERVSFVAALRGLGDEGSASDEEQSSERSERDQAAGKRQRRARVERGAAERDH